MPSEIFSSAAQGAAAGSAFGPWGAAIGGIGGALLGGLFSKNEAEGERARQEEFAKSGIQWRVQDAKAAGVHPLFALGAAPASFSPIMSGAGQAFSQAGQDISRAAMAAQDNDVKRELLAVQMESGRASAVRDYATASAQDALAAKTLQEMNASKGVPSLPGPSVFGAGGSSAGRRSDITDSPVFPNVLDRMPPAVKIDIPKISLSDNLDKSIGPGHHPTWDSHRMWPRSDGSYFRMLMPSKEAAEKMESMGEVVTPLVVLRKNVEEFGAPWLHEIVGPGFNTMVELAGMDFANEVRFHAERLMRQPRSFFNEWRRRKESNRPSPGR